MEKRRFRMASVRMTDPEVTTSLPGEILATRIFEEERYDAAVMGTVIDPDGAPVLVYNWEKLEDIRARQMIKQLKWKPDRKGHYDSDEGSPWLLASQELSEEIQTYYLNRTGPMPVIVGEAVDEPEDYPESVAFYEIGGKPWVSWPFDH